MQPDYKLLVTFLNELFLKYDYINILDTMYLTHNDLSNFYNYDILHQNEYFAFARHFKNFGTNFLIVFTD